MFSLTEDLAKLTQVPKGTLDRLVDKSVLIIASDLTEKEESNCVIDIGIGTLALNIVDDEIYYKFIPSLLLEKNLIQALNGDNVLIEALDKSLESKISSTYKELL